MMLLLSEFPGEGVNCETGEAFADYMDRNFCDLPCVRIEMDEQWQYVGCHAGRLPKDDKTERGDYWLWCCIDADTKLVFSHKVGKRDYWTGNQFVEDVRNRVKLAGLRKPYHEPRRARISDCASGTKEIWSQNARIQQKRRNAQARGRNSFRRLQLCAETSQPWNDASRGCRTGRKAVDFRKGR